MFTKNFLLTESDFSNTFAVIGKSDNEKEQKQKVILAIREEYSSESVKILNYDSNGTYQITLSAELTDEDDGIEVRDFELTMVEIY